MSAHHPIGHTGLGWRVLANLIFVSLALTASAQAQVGTERFASGLTRPVYLDAPPADTVRVFVAELAGVVKIIEVDTGVVRTPNFLTGPVGEDLLGMAFHPDYANNGYAYFYFQEPGVRTRVIRYEPMPGDPDQADPASALTIIDVPANDSHVGGWLGFGPDGYLYLNIGDNGDFDVHDPAGNGQSTTGELLANVLRLDVDGDDFLADPDRNYAIPGDNPFVGQAGEDEIWAYGLRNPWRGSFDRETGDFFFGDVGQDTREEVNFERADDPGGHNYGWRLREGSIATPTGGVGGPQPPDGVDPIYDYVHGSGTSEGFSVTGGYVYRGPIVAIHGLYFFADFVNARIWSMRVDRDTGVTSDFTDWTTTFTPDVGTIEDIVSFGEDAAGDLYIVDWSGEIFKVVGPVAAVPVLGPLAIGILSGLLVAVGLRREL